MIKVFIFFSCLFLYTITSAQTIENFGNLSLQINKHSNIAELLRSNQALYQGLNTSKISTGILYDKIIPFSGIEKYSGDNTSGLSSKAVLKQLYFELSQASVRESEGKTFAQIESAYATEDNVIPIALLNYRYNKIKEDGLSKDLKLNRNGNLIKKHLTIETAFLTKRAFASAALKERTFRGSKVTFRLPEELYLSNHNENVSQIRIDFDDTAGFRQVNINQDIFINYTSTGIKNISVEITTADHSALKSSFSFEVKALTSPDHTDIELTSDIPYENVFASGTAYVYKSPLNPQVKNPIFILEGFDTSNELFAEELYEIVNQQNLAENLLSKGYDIIIVNFTDATTYIQANAMLTVKLVTYINEHLKAGENPNIVIGASMGGLVARYALSYMELNQMTHQTALFVSFDTPYQGANIPLGDQYWLNFFASQNTTAAEKLNQINSVAAQQMLVYHQLSFPNPNLLRQNLMNELSTLGYPRTCRNIAISNGNATGIGQSYNPGDPMVVWRYRNFWVDIDGNTWAVPDGEPLTQITYCRLDKFGPGYSSFRVNVGGTSPYDTAPGGSRATNGQIADTHVRQGDIRTENPTHCFIPTISSLDIDTEDLFYNIANDADILCKTPFQAIYFPTLADASANQEHVTITNESVVWIMNELQFVDNALSESIALRVNFQNNTETPPQGWIKDEGKAFSVQTQAGKTYTYGWKRRDNMFPVNLTGEENLTSGNGVKRSAPCNSLQSTFIYMQGDDKQGFNGIPVESYWEIAVENGTYQVTVSVGDSEAYQDSSSESHSINIEGVSAIDNFVPSGESGSATRFKQVSVNIAVEDGVLTLDADGGTNTKINYVIIQPINNAATIANSLSSHTRLAAAQSTQKGTQNQFSIYPNPFIDKLMLQHMHLGKIHITLYDMIGNKYYEANNQIDTESFILNLSATNLKSGMYLLTLQAEDGSIQTARVLKK